MAKTVLKGIAVSAGVAIGTAYFLNRSHAAALPRTQLSREQVPAEVVRLGEAFEVVSTKLRQIRMSMPAELREHAMILDSHLLMLEDPKLRGMSEEFIISLGLNAEWALEKAVGELEKIFAALEDDYFRERLSDVRLVAQRVRDQLLGMRRDPPKAGSRVVLMAFDLTPADTAELEIDSIMSFCTVSGGKTSHTGIMARTLDIPAVVGVSGLEEGIRDGDTVIVDGLSGEIIVEPDDAEIARYQRLLVDFENYHASIMRTCHLPGETTDGCRVRVQANIELMEEAVAVLDNGGEGVGLYRTEYSFLNRKDLPDEDELAEEYTDLASIIAPRRIVFRTLDLGADKFISHFGGLEEPNPALGLRAIRFCMRHIDLFKSQMRAICRASKVGNVAIMFPMISGLRELLDAKRVLYEVQAELRAQGLPSGENMPVGIMMELPSAVWTAEILAREVDFFSIGTNDLIQYSLGIDRTNRYVSHLYQPLHPAVVRSIKHVVDAAHQAGIEVSLCGEMSSDPYCVPVLLGMRLDCLSMSPRAIPGIKRIIRRTSMAECKQLLKLVLESPTVTRTNRIIQEIFYEKFPEELKFFSSLIESSDDTAARP